METQQIRSFGFYGNFLEKTSDLWVRWVRHIIEKSTNVRGWELQFEQIRIKAHSSYCNPCKDNNYCNQDPILLLNLRHCFWIPFCIRVFLVVKKIELKKMCFPCYTKKSWLTKFFKLLNLKSETNNSLYIQLHTQRKQKKPIV